MVDQIDDRMTRLATATRGVRMALDILSQEIGEMEKLSDVMKLAIDGLQRETDDKMFDIPFGIKPEIPEEKRRAINTKIGAA